MSSVRVIAQTTAISIVPAVITTTDAYGGVSGATDTIVDVRGMGPKGILVQNTGVANSLTYTVLGSYDDGAAYDIVVQADTAVALSAQSNINVANCFTHLKIRVKSTGAGLPTTAQIKLVAISN